MNILCNTKEELKKILERLGKDGCKWHNRAQLVKWGLENVYAPVVIIVYDKEVVYDNDIDDYAQFVTADKFFAANPEKEAVETGERLKWELFKEGK